MKMRRRWMWFSLLVLVLGCVVYFGREKLKRALIAVSIYRAHTFTAPAASEGDSWLGRLGEEARFYWDFAAIPIERTRRLKLMEPTLKPLIDEISHRQEAGQDMQVPLHTYREIRWRLNFTPDMAMTERRIADLRSSLAAAAVEPSQTDDKQDEDGSWARGIDVWYLKLYYSVDSLKACREAPAHAVRYLDRINSPAQLEALLDADLRDDFTKTGVFNREELDETFSGLARMLFTNSPVRCYNFDPRLKEALRGFVNRWQNPATGYWGQWMVDRQGKIWKMDDMAITFHVVSDLHGEVDHLDRIAKRTLELDGVNFPAGVRFNGHYENHLNWDVVKILRMAWPTLDEATRERARAEIRRMLQWCLEHSYQQDGSFQVSDLDDTAGDAYEYGANFLVECGYFRPTDRFWTTEEFPEAKEIHDRIEAKLKATGLNDPKLRGVYEMLESSAPVDTR